VTESDSSAADRRWLAANWPFVRERLPPPPRRVLDIGCGPLGGFVPALRAAGYHADGIDPEAPQGRHYHQVEFEEYAGRQPAHAIVASTSLHHVSDLETVVDLITGRLEPDGVLVVVEWARERFDEASARWCFDRLADDEPGWLHRHRDNWLASGQPWAAYIDSWAANEGMYTAEEILRSLAERFDTRLLTHGPYFFPDLHGVTAADEQTAIDAGRIQANGVRYVGRPLRVPG
jgi:SAM-dependent methyltransferase